MASRDSARKFHFLREIASGGFGSVYLAKVMHADGFSRIAAVKLLHRRWSENREIAQRMRDEARLLGWLRHRNIVDVIDLTSIDGRAAVIMEYLEAVDLKTVVQSLGELGGVMPSRSALEVVSYVASALDAAYNRPPFQGEKPLRVIHRDIKPSNIMVDEAGTVKVLDFGVARAEFENRESHTQELQFGSVDYMPPERLFFEPETDLSDVYSLGATLFEVLAGVKLGKAKGRAEKHAVFLEDRLSFLAARNPLAAPHGEAVLGLVRAMCAYVPDQRPRATDVVTRCRALVRAIEGDTLAEWAEHAVPPMLKALRDAGGEPNPLHDAVLAEDSILFSQAELQSLERMQELSGGVVVGSEDAVPAEIPREDARWELLRKAALAEMVASEPKAGAGAKAREVEPGKVKAKPSPPPAPPTPLPVAMAPDTSLGGEPMEATLTGTGARASAAVAPQRHAEATAPGRGAAAEARVVIDPTLSGIAPANAVPAPAPVVAGRGGPELFEEEPTRVGQEDPRRAMAAAGALPVVTGNRAGGPVDEPPAFPSPRRPTSVPEPGVLGQRMMPGPDETLRTAPTSPAARATVPPPPSRPSEPPRIPAPTRSADAPTEKPARPQPAGPSPSAARVSPAMSAAPVPARDSYEPPAESGGGNGGLYLAIAVVVGGLLVGMCAGVGWLGWSLSRPTGEPAVAGVPSEPAPEAAPEAAPSEPKQEAAAAPVEDLGPDAVRFVSEAADTQRITVSCGGEDYTGTSEVAVPGPKAGACTIRVILKDRSRINAQVASAQKGTYRCFSGGAKECVR